MSDDEQPAELVGATDEPVTLTGATTATSVPVSAPTGPAARTEESARPAAGALPERREHRGRGEPRAALRRVRQRARGRAARPRRRRTSPGRCRSSGSRPAANDDDDREEAPHSLRHVFDITSLAATLSEQGRWDPEQLHVTFSPIGIEDEAASALDVPPVRIGRVSLFMQ